MNAEETIKQALADSASHAAQGTVTETPSQPTAKKNPQSASKLTPMMKQYLGIKSECGDEALLFYRMGDFYELFFGDAVRAAAALDIALTKRGKHKGEDIPMCGVPVHSAETYLQRLIKKGFRVAVCEQTESPIEAKKRGSKSVVRREIVRLVTPGTLTEDTLLDARGANFIACLVRTPTGDMGLSWADISDGTFQVCLTTPARAETELAALSPREIVIADSLIAQKDMADMLERTGASLTPLPDVKFDARSGERRLKTRYGVKALDGFGDFARAELSAAGALMDYLELTQAGGRVELVPPARRQSGGYVAIDPATRASLEITTSQNGGKSGSLLGAIDRTITGPGARLLADRLSRPLTGLHDIAARLDAVDGFAATPDMRRVLRGHLKAVGDVARAASRLALGRGGPRDLLVIRNSLKQGEQINADFARHSDWPLPDNSRIALNAVSLARHAELSQLVNDLRKALKDDVPMMARDGGFIAAGWMPDLDNLRSLRDDSRRVIAGLQGDYAKALGVTSLKIKHNNVLGYFIEVTPRHADAVMGKPDFIHRQTLVSGVRFTTTELAELDAKISGAADKALALEIEAFENLSARIRDLADTIRAAGQGFAALDVQSALAEWASEQNAVRPVVDDSLQFSIEGGRHPVVEAALRRAGDAGFTPNDCLLDGGGDTAPRLTLITGPNMAGKSTYLRQNALMFVLAQAGSFVPARKAHIGIADSVFSRVGASDDLSKGRSTFMVEMIETAGILNLAGPKSFVILDEIGRGTATFDGLSIAWATAEHLHAINLSRALFATHYHELTDLAEALPHAGNAALRAKEWNGELVFLHDVISGVADKSYGVQVAKLAGLPAAAVERAREVLTRLEQEHDGAGDLGNLPLFTAPVAAKVPAAPSEIETALADLDVDNLSARQALDILYEFQAKAAKSTKDNL